MHARTRRRTVLRAALVVGVFLVLGLPWIRHAWTALPADDAVDDAWLVLWVLDWVRHTLGTAPGLLFDPPVNWPAPRQLSGSEHFLASQLVFAPLAWVTGSAVAAANLTALLSYALAAALMDALLVALGVTPSAAVVAAVAYGFGWHGTPGRMHILQSQHLWLPLVALVLHRLRDRPTPARAAAVGAAFVGGLLSSYHMAVYLSVGAAVWGLAELARPGAGRARYAALASAAGAVALGGLVLVSIPYLVRPEARGEVELVFSRWKTSHLGAEHADFVNADLLLVVRSYLGCALGGGQRLTCVPIDWLAERTWTLVGAGALPPAALLVPLAMLAGVWSAVRAHPAHRAVVGAGLALVLVGLLFWGPESVEIGGLAVPFPRTFLAASPARFIRVPQRALVLSFFGGWLVVACGIAAAFARLGRVARAVLAIALVASIVTRLPTATAPPWTPWSLLERCTRLTPVRYLENAALGPDATSYEALAVQVREAGGGPLVDLPATDDGTAVVGQMIHRQPSVCFYTGYLPAHVSLVESLIAALPDAGALDDLVDMTGLRWIVLRPEAEWPSAEAFRHARAALVRHPRVRAVTTAGRFTLVELDPTSHHPDWYRSLVEGPRRGRSALGTPLAPLALDGRAARLTVELPVGARAGEPVEMRATVANDGAEAWPAPVPARPDTPFGVVLEVRWRAPDGSHGDPDVHPLRRDLPSHTALTQLVPVIAPERPGRYGVEVVLHQTDGGALASFLGTIEIGPRIGYRP